jgi:hypothetical protein
LIFLTIIILERGWIKRPLLKKGEEDSLGNNLERILEIK